MVIVANLSRVPISSVDEFDQIYRCVCLMPTFFFIFLMNGCKSHMDSYLPHHSDGSQKQVVVWMKLSDTQELLTYISSIPPGKWGWHLWKHHWHKICRSDGQVPTLLFWPIHRAHRRDRKCSYPKNTNFQRHLRQIAFGGFFYTVKQPECANIDSSSSHLIIY